MNVRRDDRRTCTTHLNTYWRPIAALMSKDSSWKTHQGQLKLALQFFSCGIRVKHLRVISVSKHCCEYMECAARSVHKGEAYFYTCVCLAMGATQLVYSFAVQEEEDAGFFFGGGGAVTSAMKILQTRLALMNGW